MFKILKNFLRAGQSAQPTIKVIKPELHHYKDYYELCQQPSWQREFLNLRSITLEESKVIMYQWQHNDENRTKNLFRFIEYGGKIIGFIANTNAGADDELKSGFNMLLNYAISENYGNMGLMTKALRLCVEEMYKQEYNIVSAFVKPGNISSEKVLLKNGFDIVRDEFYGKSFVKPLKIDLNVYREAFNL